MTTTDPQRLADGLDEALGSWAAPAREHLPSALFCADPMPLDPAVLCRRLAGHTGLHASDGHDTWPTPTDPAPTDPAAH